MNKMGLDLSPLGQETVAIEPKLEALPGMNNLLSLTIDTEQLALTSLAAAIIPQSITANQGVHHIQSGTSQTIVLITGQTTLTPTTQILTHPTSLAIVIIAGQTTQTATTQIISRPQLVTH